MHSVNRFCHRLLFSATLTYFDTIRLRHICCWVLLTTIITSCSTNQVNYSPIENQQHQWQELKSEYPVNKSALKGLLTSATLSNNWKLMWLIELELCQIETDAETKLDACKKAKQLSLVFYQDPSLQFDTSLVLYEQFHQHQDLLDANRYATTETQKIDVLLAQSIVPTKTQQQGIASGSLQEARLLYLLGKNTEDTVLLSKAAQLFWQHRQINKQADSLYLLAMLKWALGQNEEARSNAVKSLMLHARSNNNVAMKTIQRWLDEH